MQKIKDYIYNIIREDNKNNTLGKIFNFIIITFILLSIIVVISETFNLPKSLSTIYYYVDIISVIIFTIEYILRIFTSTCQYPSSNPLIARLKYIISFMAIIDLLAILPFYIPFIIPIDLRVLRTIRIVRLFRLFKLNRYTDALTTIGTVIKRKSSQLLSSLFVVMLLMITASVLMYNVENLSQPDKFCNAFSALWWAVATLTTVGYGDIYPITFIGKLLSGIIALLGIGLVAVPTGIISAGFMEIIETSKETTDKKNYCPYCGNKL